MAPGPLRPRTFTMGVGRTRDHCESGAAAGFRRTKGMRRGSPTSGQAATIYPSYLRAAEGADILHVSPKTVSRWAKEGKLTFLKTLGGHRRYPEAEIRQLAKGLREEATA